MSELNFDLVDEQLRKASQLLTNPKDSKEAVLTQKMTRLDALENAYYSGVREVQLENGAKTIYRSADDLLRAIDNLKQDITDSGGPYYPDAMKINKLSLRPTKDINRWGRSWPW
ncbi:phage head-tail joining protein [Photobacterium phosphoreum]|uniref:phage head-tail joining protein n=1 Tax=Photobacterium phosphoreum TaxID=659 RepID=UPI0024B7FB7C|nr:hypothetical protein [Photobacterium phosphoreum]